MANMGLLRPFRWISGFIVETENLRRDKQPANVCRYLQSNTLYYLVYTIALRISLWAV